LPLGKPFYQRNGEGSFQDDWRGDPITRQKGIDGPDLGYRKRNSFQRVHLGGSMGEVMGGGLGSTYIMRDGGLVS